MHAAIEARGLARSFPGVQALRSLDLTVRPGETYGFLGLNGAGKTTTLKMLTTLLRPTGGSARVAGHDVVAEPLAVRRSIGVLNELESVTQPYWTPREYLGHFARLRGMDPAEGRTRAQALLRRLGIADVANVPIGTFSSGMKRKVEVARALLHDPPILFLDEPTRELDIPSKSDLWALLDDLVRTRQRTVFLCSHDVLEVERLCDRVGVLHQGRLLHEARVHELSASEVVRLHGPQPDALLQTVKATGLAREAWRDDDSVLAIPRAGARRAWLLREVVKAGAEVDEFGADSRLGERLAALMRGEAP